MLIDCTESSAIISKWDQDKPIYDELRTAVVDFLELEISQLEILPQISGRTKDLPSIIKKIIKKRSEGNSTYNYDSLKDKVGFRIVCDFKSELEKIHNFIDDNFDIKHFEEKSKKLKFNELDYVSNHYDLILKPSNPSFKDKEKLFDIIFELQVRTINQNCWADIAHDLVYKQDIMIDEKMKRRVFRLVSLYELADDEFDNLHQIISSHPDYPVYNILSLIEGKFYKYARVHFDSEISFLNLKNLIPVLSTGESQGITSFIVTNEAKIISIFSDQNLVTEKNIFISQPEVFLIWFLIEKHPAVLKDTWKNYYDPQDLDELAQWWGTPISIY